MKCLTDKSENKKLILFGAGKRGKEALERYGRDNVAFFCDNDREKQGKKINGVIVLSFDDMVDMYCEEYIVMVTLGSPCFLIGQLEKVGITDYLLYHDITPRIVKYDNEENNEEKEHNDFLRNYVKASTEEDLLVSIDRFKVIVKKAIEESKEKEIPLNYYTRGAEEEGYRYGNLQTLQRFAGIDTKEGVYSPTISHVFCLPIYTPIYEYKTAVVFSGDYYKKKIHEKTPWLPVFTVGPYIHYAKEIYDCNEMRKRKERMGTMLLVFLPHTLEDAQRSYDRKRFLELTKSTYQAQYDEIWLCVYFADINDEICEYAEKLGMHIVSAGFRFDPFFNDRLKTIIKLSDAVVCGDIGSFLTYSIYLKKPISRIEISDRTSILEVQYNNEIERNIEKTKDYIKFEKDFYQLFNEQLCLNESQEKWMDSLAGFQQIRSEEYIRRIFSISDDIWKLSNGNYRNYPDAVRKAYYMYNDNNDYEKMYMLKQAVGNFLD